MKLELKHLAAYLPYGFEVKDGFSGKTWKITKGEELDYLLENSKISDSDFHHKPLLHPLSRLTTPFSELDGKTPMDAIKTALWRERYGWPRIYTFSEYKEGKDGIVLLPTDSGISIRCVPDYYMVPQSAFEKIRETLLSLHFDIWNLIPANLALPKP